MRQEGIVTTAETIRRMVDQIKSRNAEKTR